MNALQTLWHNVVELHDAIDDCWVGDLIAVISIFGAIVYFLIATGVL